MQGDAGPPSDRVRVVVVDDSAPLRETVVAALAGHPAVEVVGTADDGAGAVRVVGETQPDVVLLDLRLGDAWGLDLVPTLRAGDLGPAVVVFSASDAITREAALAAGAHGQVAKGAPVGEIAAVLVAAAAMRRDRAPGPQS